jgi:hypothetical protein
VPNDVSSDWRNIRVYSDFLNAHYGDVFPSSVSKRVAVKENANWGDTGLDNEPKSDRGINAS